jgi:hypothetical protein
MGFLVKQYIITKYRYKNLRKSAEQQNKNNKNEEQYTATKYR